MTREEVKFQKAWNACDDLMLHRIIECGSVLIPMGETALAADQINWLKALPERFNLQPKNEQPEVDLEKFDKEVTKIWGRCAAEPNDSIACLHIETFNEVARHFAKWGAEHRDGALSCPQPSDDLKRKENGKVHYPSYKSGYFDGRADEKKQMKEKAISGSVHHALNTHYIEIDQPQLNAILKEFDQDEKVKIIILHDNE